jgi:hypothetical protein
MSLSLPFFRGAWDDVEVAVAIIAELRALQAVDAAA